VTSALTLRVQKHLEIAGREIATGMGAVATLRQITDGSGKLIDASVPVDVVIPANNAGDGRRVPVAPGLWIVEATLPSGELIAEQVNVEDGKEVPLVLRAAERSPNEWLGWQHLLGNIEGQATLEMLQERARKIAEALAKGAHPGFVAWVSDLAARGVGYLWRMCAAPIAALWREITNAESRNTPGSITTQREQPSLLPSADAATDAPSGTAASAETAKPVVHIVTAEAFSTGGADSWTAILSSDPTGLPHPVAAGTPDMATWLYDFKRPLQPAAAGQPIDLQPREFVFVTWRGERYAIALPLPWPELDSQAPVAAQIMVRDPPLQQHVQIGVAVMDKIFGPLSGFMTASTLPKAAVAVDDAYDMLFEKTRNPLAAAAAGYILIAAGDPAERDWHAWIDNLERLFPTLPDGAVLKASLLLRFARDQTSIDQAREAFLSAYDRGIPYFSIGVSWLLDGLTMFSGYPDIEEKLAKVHRIAQRLDFSQAFTVVRLSDRPELRQGMQDPAVPRQSMPTPAPNGGSIVMTQSITPTTFSTVNLQPEATASLGLPEFVNTLLDELKRVKEERSAYYEGLRKSNSQWANGARRILSLLGSIAFLLTALAAAIRFAPVDWKLGDYDKIALLTVLALYAIMGTISFYERGTDRTAAYFRHLSVILAIRDLWTKLQFELLKEFTALNSAADKAAAVPAVRERIRALAEAFCGDLDKLSTSELSEWRADFTASLSDLADTAKKGSEDVTKQLQDAVKAAEKSAAEAKVAAETAAKAATEAGKPGSLNVTVSGDFEGEVVLSVDGVEVARSTGKLLAIEHVVPGTRKFNAVAQKGQKKLETSKMVEVKPGLQDLALSLT
jgi:hypothetical protein